MPMMANDTGCMPTDCASGCNTVPTIMMAGIASRKQPTTRNAPAITNPTPVMQPLAQSVGMHPVSFAIIGIVSLAFGLVTPPYGLCLMISCAVANVPMKYALKDTMIMLIPMLLVLCAIIIWPEIPLILPRFFAPELLK